MCPWTVLSSPAIIDIEIEARGGRWRPGCRPALPPGTGRISADVMDGVHMRDSRPVLAEPARHARPAIGRTLLCAVVASLLVTLQAAPARAGDLVETSGDVLRLAIPAVAVALTVQRDDKEGRHQFYKALGTTVAATWGLKQVVDKERPNGHGSDAFPSGHASLAFEGAAFIHRRYGIKQAWPAYLLATYVAWTRVDANEHDSADVLGGAAIGIASSFVFTDRWQRVTVSAASPRDGIGIRFSGRF
jgi:membrane-associated phospholipid phosphatase